MCKQESSQKGFWNSKILASPWPWKQSLMGVLKFSSCTNLQICISIGNDIDT